MPFNFKNTPINCNQQWNDSNSLNVFRCSIHYLDGTYLDTIHQENITFPIAVQITKIARQMEISLNFVVQERAKFTWAFPTNTVHKSGCISETFRQSAMWCDWKKPIYYSCTRKCHIPNHGALLGDGEMLVPRWIILVQDTWHFSAIANAGETRLRRGQYAFKTRANVTLDLSCTVSKDSIRTYSTVSSLLTLVEFTVYINNLYYWRWYFTVGLGLTIAFQMPGNMKFSLNYFMMCP